MSLDLPTHHCETQACATDQSRLWCPHCATRMGRSILHSQQLCSCFCTLCMPLGDEAPKAVEGHNLSAKMSFIYTHLRLCHLVIGNKQRASSPSICKNKKILKNKKPAHTNDLLLSLNLKVLREDNARFCVCHHPMHVQSTRGFAGPQRRCQIIGSKEHLCKKITL